MTCFFTNSIAVVIHLLPVSQVHGPNMAVKQARWVRNCVRPWTTITMIGCVFVNIQKVSNTHKNTLHWITPCCSGTDLTPPWGSAVLRLWVGMETHWTVCPQIELTVQWNEVSPSSPLALLVWNGDVVALVVDLSQRPVIKHKLNTHCYGSQQKACGKKRACWVVRWTYL